MCVCLCFVINVLLLILVNLDEYIISWFYLSAVVNKGCCYYYYILHKSLLNFYYRRYAVLYCYAGGLSFFTRRNDMLHRSQQKLGPRRARQVPNFTVIGVGDGIAAPKLWTFRILTIFSPGRDDSLGRPLRICDLCATRFTFGRPWYTGNRIIRNNMYM